MLSKLEKKITTRNQRGVSIKAELSIDHRSLAADGENKLLYLQSYSCLHFWKTRIIEIAHVVQ